MRGALRPRERGAGFKYSLVGFFGLCFWLLALVKVRLVVVAVCVCVLVETGLVLGHLVANTDR